MRYDDDDDDDGILQLTYKNSPYMYFSSAKAMYRSSDQRIGQVRFYKGKSDVLAASH